MLFGGIIYIRRYPLLRLGRLYTFEDLSNNLYSREVLYIENEFVLVYNYNIQK